MIGIGLVIAIGPAIAMMGLGALVYVAFTRWHLGGGNPRPGA